ncbi:MAG: PKD domain-containing protein [Bacteroidales bacterium]
MKKLHLFGIVLAAVMTVVSCQKNPEFGPAVNTGDENQAQYETYSGDVIKDQYIVVLNEFPGNIPDGYAPGLERAREVIEGLLAENRIPEDKIAFVYAFALDGFSATLTAEEVDRLARDRRVSYIEPDAVMTIFGSQSNATWGIDRVDQRDLPLNQTYTWDATGTGVNAYIIDTGIRYDHKEFGTRASFGFDAFGEDGSDGNGHGTHVAGTVGGTTYGVAKNVSLVAVRVLDNSGSGTTSGVIAGMDWVASNHIKPAVANMSLGGGASDAIDDAVGRMYDAGVPVIVAAGNGNRAGREQDACGYSPARAPNAYTVGATVSTDAKASYSNYGDCVDLFAPGSSITSAWYTSSTAINTISGTSMATPHVAGGAALFLETTPGATAQQVYDAITTNSTKNKVTSSKTTNNHLLYTLGFGSGGSTNQPPNASFTFTTNELTASFDASGSSDSDGSIVSYAWDFGDESIIGSGATISHTYAAAGTYEVTLTVTDNEGATDTNSQNVTVSDPATGNTPPTASFTFTTNDLTASFDASGSSDSDGTIASYAWDFGDGTTGSGITASRTYSAAGTYTVKLMVTDNEGATDSQTKSVTVTAPASGDDIVLSVYAYKVRGRKMADLSWIGVTTDQVEIFRDGSLVTTVNTSSNGSYTDNIGQVGGGTHTYYIKEVGPDGRVSNSVTVTY